ncbi:MAG: glycosyl hydrolase, partial [Gemmatimonadetes bacterium]|nr:glycosyl hydrolase [Gemmatimonadota bacterium]
MPQARGSRTARYWIAVLGVAVLASGIPAGSISGQAVVDTSLLAGMKYRSIGPARGGRVTAVAGLVSEPLSYFMGSTGGGVWRTDDAGASWRNVSDGQFGAASVGAIAVADSDPNVVWVGMGSACIRGNTSQGDGVYRSLDGGKSWTHSGLPEAGQIGRIAVDPRNPDVAFVAALGHPFGPNSERGVYRTRDGGAEWENVLFVSDSTGAVDLALNPANPRIIYAGMWRAERKPWTMISGASEGGIYRSNDSGDTWTRLEGGLPDGLVGKTAVTVSPANPDRVWVLIEAPDEKGGVYRSDDAGETWNQVNTNRDLQQRAWYYTHIYADPADENTVYALNVNLWKSIDGGRTFNRIGVPHGDTHDLWIHPADPEVMVIGNDGGAQVSLNGGESWSTMYNQPTAEIYRVFVDEQFPYRVYGSQQDNSTISLPSLGIGGLTPSERWRSAGGCESGHIAIDPRDPDVTYAGCYGGSISRVNYRTGAFRQILVYPQMQLGQAPKTLRYRFQWNAPVRLSPHDPDVLYHTSQFVHRSTDGGATWETVSPDLTRNDTTKQDFAGSPITMDNTGVEVYGTIFSFEESALEPGVLWAGSDDGLVHVSRDNGGTWTDVSPSDMPEWGTVNTIEVSQHAPGRAFIAVHRYRQDDFRPYIFRTDNYGEKWDELTDGNGIPDSHFVRVIREDRVRQELLFAGTEFGMYVSFNGGEDWQDMQRNLPVTPITDMRVHRGDLVVATQGRSFWILDDLSPLRQIDSVLDSQGPHLFTPADAYRARVSGGGPDGRPSGAILYYFLPSEPSESIAIEILDTAGGVLRTLTWDPGESSDGEGPEKFERTLEGDSITASPGLNRANWDLRLGRPDLLDEAVIWGFTGGPQVAPGTYQVRLTVGSTTATRELRLLPDPRLDISDEDQAAQFELMLNIRESLQASHAAVERLRSAREQLRDRAERGEEAGYGDDLQALADSAVARLDRIEGQIVQTKSESGQDPLNFPPKLDNQLAYLYGYVGFSDGAPTAGAIARYADLLAELESHQRDLEEVLAGPVSD